jgi:flagellar biosynthetic protein FliR
MEPIILPLRPMLIFLVVLARVSGLVTFAPFWSNKSAPARVRVVLAFVLSLVSLPVVASSIKTPPADPIGLGVVILGELAIGFVLGFGGRLVFSALDIAAQILTIQIGLSLASTIDPSTKAQTTAVGTLAQMFGLMVLMGADGHHWALAATVSSFQTLSPGEISFSGDLLQIPLRLSADALSVGVALAAPAIIILLAVEFLIAIAGRAAPQLQVMVLSFPLKIIAGIWLTGAALYFMPGAVRTALVAMKGGLGRLIGTM